MNPVAARARFWGTESLSAGRDRSLTPAATSAHLAVNEPVKSGGVSVRSVRRATNGDEPRGAQKKMVLNESRAQA
jgi:hypothetical protein